MLGVLESAGDPARDLPVGTPGQRPCGLPSHLVRLNGAGHTGRRRQLLLRGSTSCIPAVVPWMASNGHRVHLSPNDPNDRRF